MKIKVFSNDKGKILAAVIPAPEGKQGSMISCGPALQRKQAFSDITLPTGTREKDLADLLARSRIKRTKGEYQIEITSRTSASYKKPRAYLAKKPATKKRRKS